MRQPWDDGIMEKWTQYVDSAARKCGSRTIGKVDEQQPTITKREHQNRHAVMPSLDPTTLDRLLTMMYNINPIVEVFKMARDMMATEGVPMDLKLRLITFRTKNARRYNVSTADEIATLMVGDGFEVVDRRDIVLAQQAGPFQRIFELHVGYMALHYPLGWMASE
jgi:hypothetical protein